MKTGVNALVLVCSALMLCSCASGSRNLAPPLAVDLGALATCEQVLAPVALPAVTPNKTDANAAFVKDEAALMIAIDEIETGRGCVQRVRESYSGKLREDGRERPGVLQQDGRERPGVLHKDGRERPGERR
jgi:hypothetical protein